MFAPELDRALHPQLYAVHDGAATLPLGVYLDAAHAGIPDGKPVAIRWPAGPGLPLTVLSRLEGPHASGTAPPMGGAAGGKRHQGDNSGPDGHRGEADAGAPRHDRDDTHDSGGGRGDGFVRPRMVLAYLDPPSGRLLGTADPRGGIAGFIRSLHTDLLVPLLSGRQIVGWNGVGLFVLSVTGLYLWWPRNARFLRGLAWRRGPTTVMNLHHRIGFWIAAPLAVMALTGVYQAFPQQGRAAMGLIAAVSETGRQGFRGRVLAAPRLSPQKAWELASSQAPSAKPVSLTFPQTATGAWRVQLAGENGKQETYVIEDGTSAVSRQPEPLRGDAVLAFMRRLHEGRDYGPVWTVVVLSAGLALPTLLITGLIMWVRRRKASAASRRASPGYRPAAAE